MSTTWLFLRYHSPFALDVNWNLLMARVMCGFLQREGLHLRDLEGNRNRRADTRLTITYSNQTSSKPRGVGRVSVIDGLSRWTVSARQLKRTLGSEVEST